MAYTCEAEVERDLCGRLERLGFTVRQQVTFPTVARIGKRKTIRVDVVAYNKEGVAVAMFEVKRRTSRRYPNKQRLHYEALSEAFSLPHFYIAPDNIADLSGLVAHLPR